VGGISKLLSIVRGGNNPIIGRKWEESIYSVSNNRRFSGLRIAAWALPIKEVRMTIWVLSIKEAACDSLRILWVESS
jgi:hypothetical protein